MAVTPEQQAQFQALSRYLADIGLDSLFSISPSGDPGGWLWQQLQGGVDTPEEIAIAIQSTDAFRDRFGVIYEQQKRAAAGDPVTPMTPAEVLEYETRARQLMSAAGLPPTFYDEPKDFHRLILEDMSITEVQERITQAYDYVLSAPPEVRAAFNEFYGVGQGDAQLAAWALDPDRTVRDINRATRTAYAAGMADRFDVSITREAAERIAELPRTEAGIAQGMEQVASMSPLYNEGLSERATDITSDTGVEAVFEGSGDAQRDLQRRRLQRSANNRSTAGGAITTREGVVGIGTS